jgi:two-component system nitrate/nitrite response regulator NarL
VKAVPVLSGVLIVSGESIIALGTRREFEQRTDVDFIGVANTVEIGLEQLEEHSCHVVFVDLPLAAPYHIAQLKKLKVKHQQNHLIVLLHVDDFPIVYQALFDAGVRGFLNREAALNEMIASYQTIIKGVVPISASFLSKLSESGNAKNIQCERLTDTEKQVLKYIASGFTNEKIAKKLNVCRRTVEKHLTATYNEAGYLNQERKP